LFITIWGDSTVSLNIGRGRERIRIGILFVFLVWERDIRYITIFEVGEKGRKLLFFNINFLFFSEKICFLVKTQSFCEKKMVNQIIFKKI